jgi:hypothetical protein
MQSVGGRAGINIVRITILTATFNVFQPDGATLDILVRSCSVRDLRVDVQADLVAVITGDNDASGDGLITLGIANVNGFVSITGLFGLLNTFTLTHEVRYVHCVWCGILTSRRRCGWPT